VCNTPSQVKEGSDSPYRERASSRCSGGGSVAQGIPRPTGGAVRSMESGIWRRSLAREALPRTPGHSPQASPPPRGVGRRPKPSNSSQNRSQLIQADKYEQVRKHTPRQNLSVQSPCNLRVSVVSPESDIPVPGLQCQARPSTWSTEANQPQQTRPISLATTANPLPGKCVDLLLRK
jgi:hypothetical protein